MLNLNRLRVLGAVVRKGSFSGAADSLHLSQSAVSQQVATLEREVGMPLLERTSEGPKPTAAGRALIGHAEAAIARLNEAEQEVAAIAGLEGGEVRIASFSSASATLLTTALRGFHAAHPNVRLSVTEAEPEDSIPMLRAAEVDLALTFDYESIPEHFDERDVMRQLVLTESMYLALPRDHPLAAKTRVRMADLAEDTWLIGVGPSSCNLAITSACHAAGFEPRVSFESDEYHTLQAYVAAGLGYTLLPDLALPGLRSDLVVRPTEPDAPRRRVWAATRGRAASSAATEAMVETLQRAGERFADQVAEAVAA